VQHLARRHADQTGAQISGDPEALASALLKLERGATAMPAHTTEGTASLFIVNPFGALESAAGWFATHPATQERVNRLMALARSGGHRPRGASTLLTQGF
jgi:heat shock protein HtpX